MGTVPVYVISLRDLEIRRRNMTARLGALRPRSSPQGKQDQLERQLASAYVNMRQNV